MTDPNSRPFDSVLPGAEAELCVVLEGVRLIVGFDVDAEEVARREGRGELAGVTDSRALHALDRLPLGHPTSLLGIRPEHRAAIASLPVGAVEVDEDEQSVVRSLRMPVHMRYLVAVRANAASALDAVGGLWWAPYQVAVTTVAATSAQVRRAGRCGTGLIDRDGVRVAPAARRLGRMTPLLWRQAELVFDAWVRSADRPTAAAAGRP